MVCELMLHVLELILHGVEVDVTWLWDLMLHGVGVDIAWCLS